MIRWRGVRPDAAANHLRAPRQKRRDALTARASSIQVGDNPRFLDVDDVAAILGVGRSFVYDECDRGLLRCMRLGRRIKVPIEAVREYVADRMADQEREVRLAWGDRIGGT